MAENTQTPMDLVPEDAGEHREGLAAVLGRIPPGWGRWIRCGPGWYPLIVECDKRLAEICADYNVYQVKEKFGTLRYYAGLPEAKQLRCCARFCERLGELDDEQRDALLVEHETTPAHRVACDERYAERTQAAERMSAVIDDIASRSARVCELSGQAGQLMVRNGWYATLAADRAAPGWEPVPQR